jgi:sugar lactone lactonase YvrE
MAGRANAICFSPDGETAYFADKRRFAPIAGSSE